MSKSRWPTSKSIRFSFFVTGILLMILSWFLNNALDLKPVLNIVAPEYVVLKGIFEQLDKDEKVKVPIGDHGAQILLRWWNPRPPDADIETVTFIGRSTGVFNINTGRHRYELRLLTGSDGSMFLASYIWQDYEAKDLMQKYLSAELFKCKAWLFFIGILTSIVSGAWQFFMVSSPRS